LARSGDLRRSPPARRACGAARRVPGLSVHVL